MSVLSETNCDVTRVTLELFQALEVKGILTDKLFSFITVNYDMLLTWAIQSPTYNECLCNMLIDPWWWNAKWSTFLSTRIFLSISKHLKSQAGEIRVEIKMEIDWLTKMCVFFPNWKVSDVGLHLSVLHCSCELHLILKMLWIESKLCSLYL